jgi:hypothetical protein
MSVLKVNLNCRFTVKPNNIAMKILSFFTNNDNMRGSELELELLLSVRWQYQILIFVDATNWAVGVTGQPPPPQQFSLGVWSGELKLELLLTCLSVRWQYQILRWSVDATNWAVGVTGQPPSPHSLVWVSRSSGQVSWSSNFFLDIKFLDLWMRRIGL